MAAAAVMEDPAGPTLRRVSGGAPFPNADSGGLTTDIVPRRVTLRDRQTVATIVPFASRQQVPASLVSYLCDQLNREIEGGDTYPMLEPMQPDGFGAYWFQTFGAVMLLGDWVRDGGWACHGGERVGGDWACDAEWAREADWARECLGSFFIKANYPGRSSHVCNGSFLVTDGSRNRGVGRLMGEAYLDWAPRLGYTYSVFNLVYETNVASCRIWDALGFRRIGRIRGCGNLRSYPDRLIDAIIYGRELSRDEGAGHDDDGVGEERFDKIRYYLKYARYPSGAGRAEKSRLRSAAMHYKLIESVDGDKLMLKDKEVVSDPALQWLVARRVHAQHHGGINKTTASIAEKYHWSRIKETASEVIRTCTECHESGKTPSAAGGKRLAAVAAAAAPSPSPSTPTPTLPPAVAPAMTQSVDAAADAALDSAIDPAMADSPPPAKLHQTPCITPLTPTIDAAERVLALQHHHHDFMMPTMTHQAQVPSVGIYANPSDISVHPSHTLCVDDSQASLHAPPQPTSCPHAAETDLSPHAHLMLHHSHDAVSSPIHFRPPPIDPQIITHHPDAQSHTPEPAHDPFDHYSPHADLQALLGVSGSADADDAAVDRDLDMLLDHHDDDDDDAAGSHHGVMTGLD